MVNPLFRLELLQACRRGRQRRYRLLYAGWLVLEVLVLYSAYFLGSSLQPGPNEAGRFGQQFVSLFVLQQFVLLLLVTPAFMAGSITDEKTKGTLPLLLTTELTAADIILGKFLGQAVCVAELALVGLPLLCFFGMFGGVTPLILAGLGVSTLVLLLAVGAASLLASVWFRTTSEAVVGLYVNFALGAVLVGLIGPPATCLDPRHVLEPAWDQAPLNDFLWALGEYCLAWLVLAGICLAAAIALLRRACLQDRTPRGSLIPGKFRPAVGDLPLRWKARFAEGWSALPVLGWLPGWLGLTGVFTLASLASLVILANHLPGPPGAMLDAILEGHWQYALRLLARSTPAGTAFHGLGLCFFLLAGILMAVRSSGAVSTEREKQTWEALLLTPLDAKQLVRGKLWGMMDAARPFLVAYGLPVLVLSAFGGLAALLWSLFWWAAAWVSLYYMAATGIHCSVQAATSWQSLLRTLLEGGQGLLSCLLSGGALGLLLGAILFLGACILYEAFLWALGQRIAFPQLDPRGLMQYLPLLIYAIIGLFLFSGAEQLLQKAEKQIAEKDRVPQSREELALFNRRLAELLKAKEGAVQQ